MNILVCSRSLETNLHNGTLTALEKYKERENIFECMSTHQRVGIETRGRINVHNHELIFQL